MEFANSIKQLGNKVSTLKNDIKTEEATKNAFIMPFLQILGYDVFNPTEVVPEYVTDIGTKKGEKVDYAILKEGLPVILTECKHWSQNLDIHDGQLLRYFHVSKAKFAILTNGINYRFYSDLVEPNKMDEKPFLDFNITDIKDNQIEELKKFHKTSFDVDKILVTANDLKYTNELRNVINRELSNPSEAFVKLFASQVYSGRVTANVLEQFTKLTKKTIDNFLTDLVTDRLNKALKKETEIDELVVEEIKEEPAVETTAEELEGFMIIKSIVRTTIDLSRITHRDVLTYFGILVDDNNRKPLCRLYFNSGKKYIVVFDEYKKEIKIEIFCLNDIYKYSEMIIKTAESYNKIEDPLYLKTE